MIKSESGKPSKENVYYFAVMNADGTYRELHKAGELADVGEILTEATDPDVVDVAVLMQNPEEELTLTVEMAADAFGRLFATHPDIDQELDRLRKALSGIKTAQPSRSGFRPHRKKWESDKDDPSTFGGFMNKKHKKKRK